MSALVQALVAGATVVTPNNRLARDVAARHDDWQYAQGARAWPAAQVYPFALWLDRWWRRALAARVEPAPRTLLDPALVRELWYRTIADHDRALVNPRGAARLAAEAWMQFHAWRDPGESAATTLAGWHADPAVFAQWAARYAERLAALHAIDAAQLPDAVAQGADPSWLGAPARVVLHGFLALTPQQARLVDALRGAGMAIEQMPPAEGLAASRRRTTCRSPRVEIAQALGFARARLSAEPDARIAIVVADLDERRDEVIALAEEILCPEHLLTLAPDAPRPYGISLGEPLASVPIVAVALDLLALAGGSVDAASAASVLRSPFLPGAAARWTARAGVERRWLDDARRRVGWADLVIALRDCDSDLHQRFAALTPPSRAARLPREWARSWSDWLAAVGWPGTVPLGSAQWQAREAWSGALAKFAATGTITGAQPAAAALDALRALLGEMLFQPEAAPAQIQILGTLEAAGLSFDCAWLAGFDGQRWPAAIAPNPFLPLAWQRARGMPRADPDAALAQATRLTSVLGSIAREIVVSHAQTIDGSPALESPLFADWQYVDAAELPDARRFADAFGAATFERALERAAPPLAPGALLRGGARAFESQSACPFQAYARFRLDADAWPAYPDGLSAAERGTVLHAMLKSFWDAVGSQAALLARSASELAAHIADAVDTGKATLGAARWRALPPAVAHAEASRLAAMLRAWLDEGERPRPPFRVRSHETRIDGEIEGLRLRVYVDRIDELAAGGLALIDYKSGRVVPPAHWFGERPEGLQLAVYAQAVAATTAAPIRALAYAQIKAGDIAVAGLAETSDVWPALDAADLPSRGAFAGWHDARMRLAAGVERLARDMRNGIASVTPRSRGTCRHCGLQPLCRIQLLDDRAKGAVGGADDE